MARRSNPTRQRDALPTSLETLLTVKLRPPPVLLPVPVSPSFQEVISYAGDSRRFDPTRTVSPPRSVVRSASRLSVGRRLDRVRFADPRFVGLCARRKVRKQVLFALKRTRKGAGARKRRNFWSNVSCR